jgi:hypothetical protein
LVIVHQEPSRGLNCDLLGGLSAGESATLESIADVVCDSALAAEPIVLGENPPGKNAGETPAPSAFEREHDGDHSTRTHRAALADDLLAERLQPIDVHAAHRHGIDDA